MPGSFSEESLVIFNRLAAESMELNFGEVGEDAYDYTRCVRSNGTAYGTSGKCRKGTEEEKEEGGVTREKSKTVKGAKKRGSKVEKPKFRTIKEVEHALLNKPEKLGGVGRLYYHQQVPKQEGWGEPPKGPRIYHIALTTKSPDDRINLTNPIGNLPNSVEGGLTREDFMAWANENL